VTDRSAIRARAIALAAAVGLTLAAVLPAAPVAAGTAPYRFPDLRMPAPREFYFQTYNGQRRLRFATYLLNLGQGPLRILGDRSSGETEMAVRQRIYRTDGTYGTGLTPAVMRYAGDGHDHWHVQRIATYELLKASGDGFRSVRRTTGAVVGAKVGFCFFDTNAWDTSLPGAPTSRVYVESTCGVRSSLHASMGLSVGWSDKYPANFAYQWIDVTGLNPGRYRVCVTVDKFGWFRETNDANNEAYADISFYATGSTINILGSGTGSCGLRVDP
jgi:Lysyl oxidase